MSTDQPTLAQSLFADAPEGAYGRPSETASLSGESEPARRCQCGAGVSKRVARVLGDNDGVVAGCEECWRTPTGDRYSSDAVAARMALHDEGHRDKEVDCDDGGA